jgi:hypothetical protein
MPSMPTVRAWLPALCSVQDVCATPWSEVTDDCADNSEQQEVFPQITLMAGTPRPLASTTITATLTVEPSGTLLLSPAVM